MRLRLLLIALLALSGLGADCGGGSSGGASASGAAAAVASVPSGEGSGDPVAAIPEPGAALLFGVGLLIAGAATRRHRS